MARLIDQQASVLVAARLDADLSYPELAKRSGLSLAAAKHALTKLAESGAIKKAMLINSFRLGLTSYDLYCALGVSGTEEREKFLFLAQQSELVSYLLETAGPYQFIMVLNAQSPKEVDQFLQEIGRHFGAALVSSDLLIALRVAIFPPKFLSNKKSSKAVLAVESEGELEELDPVDQRILRAVSQNPMESLRTLGERLKLPHSTVGHRLSRLRERGVIVGSFWVMSALSLGLTEFRVLVSLRGLRAEIREGVFTFCRDHPQVTYLIEYLGEWQFAVGVLVPDAGAATQFVNQIYDGFGKAVRQVVLCLIHEEKKVRLYSR